MVAQSKRHKPARRKEPVRTGKPRTRPGGRGSALATRRPPVVEEELPKDDEEPKPEDLAKEEEALKAQDPEEAPLWPEQRRRKLPFRVRASGRPTTATRPSSFTCAKSARSNC